MNRVLLAGAGAEVDLSLPSGPNFTRDTFYCQKTNMYKALKSFYSNRLGKSEHDRIPIKYDPAFLFNTRGRAFRNLIENLMNCCPSVVCDLLDKSQEDCGKFEDLNKDDLKTLFNALVVEGDGCCKKTARGIAIPNEAHFNILEDYYSNLLRPNENNVRFWKIVNFYWSAFFSILLPITDILYSSFGMYLSDKYGYVLPHLDDVVHRVFDVDELLRLLPEQCYYKKLSGLFDVVLTTNYTPYVSSVVNFERARCIRLSGCLSQFEHLDMLEFEDYSTADKHIDEASFIFPYLLCQSPVKPIISQNQIMEFASAVTAMRNADEIVVLGYSFCDQDSHIASMVGKAIRDKSDLRLVNFCYRDDLTVGFDCKEEKLNLAGKLRIPESALTRIDVVPVRNYETKSFLRLCEKWARG